MECAQEERDGGEKYVLCVLGNPLPGGAKVSTPSSLPGTGSFGVQGGGEGLEAREKKRMYEVVFGCMHIENGRRSVCVYMFVCLCVLVCVSMCVCLVC